MRFRFSPKTTVVCLILAALMVRASFWQWNRHINKQAYIATLDTRLKLPIAPISSVLSGTDTDWDSLIHRRVQLSGEYDFEHEMILRNRRHEEAPGVFVLTPLKIDGLDYYILVSRGFVPLIWSDPTKRKAFQKEKKVELTGLIKDSSARKMFAPSDPVPGAGQQWVDAWLRIDLQNMSKQLPYPLLPIFVEEMGSDAENPDKEKMIQTKSGRDEMFFLPSESPISSRPSEDTMGRYPVPMYDPVIPPGRHLGYVYEWGAMALMTVLIGVILQMRRPTDRKLAVNPPSSPRPIG